MLSRCCSATERHKFLNHLSLQSTNKQIILEYNFWDDCINRQKLILGQSIDGLHNFQSISDTYRPTLLKIPVIVIPSLSADNAFVKQASVYILSKAMLILRTIALQYLGAVIGTPCKGPWKFPLKKAVSLCIVKKWDPPHIFTLMGLFILP